MVVDDMVGVLSLREETEEMGAVCSGMTRKSEQAS